MNWHGCRGRHLHRAGGTTLYTEIYLGHHNNGINSHTYKLIADAHKPGTLGKIQCGRTKNYFEKYSFAKYSLDKNSAEKYSSEKYCSEKYSSEKYSSENYSSENTVQKSTVQKNTVLKLQFFVG